MTFSLLVSIALAFLAGSNAPTPLYPVYQSEWGFSPITTTIVFGVYALAVLASLLVVGRLSDHLGRRPVLLVAIAAQAASMVVFATASDVSMLLLARVIQGLSTGAALAAAGAAMLDLDRARGTVANAVSPLAGVALGAFGSGLLVQFLPLPTHLVYLVLLGVFAVQWVGVLLMRETRAPVPGAARSLRPRIALPVAARRPMLAAIPALVAAWSLAGFYGSLGPALIFRIVGSRSLVLGALSMSVLAGGAAAAVLLLRTAGARALVALGVGALLVGSGVTYLAIGRDSLTALLAGILLSGGGLGTAFQGTVRSVIPLTPAHQRAGMLSLVYVVSYLAMGLPAIIAGYLVVYAGGMVNTAKEYAVTVMALAVLAALGAARSPRPEPVAVTGRPLAPAAFASADRRFGRTEELPWPTARNR